MSTTFKTFRQQYKILRSRGLNISNISSDKYLEFNYFKLINGYKKHFLLNREQTATEEYKPGTNIQDIIALHDFDRKIGAILFTEILIIERKIKALFAYYFSKHYGEECYLNISAYDKRKPHFKKVAIIARLLNTISKQKNDEISSYLNKFDSVPFWVLIEELDLGTVKAIYELTDPIVQQEVAGSFNVPTGEFINYFKAIYFARNKIAHNNLFFELQKYKYKYNGKWFCQVNLRNTTWHYTYARKEDREILSGKHDVAAVILSIKKFRNKKHFKKMIVNIDELLGSVDFGANLRISDVKNIMGFPKDIYDFTK